MAKTPQIPALPGTTPLGVRPAAADPRVEKIARRFSENLRVAIGVKKLTLAAHENKKDSGAGACATHDFCDSNVLMGHAFEDVLGLERGSFMFAGTAGENDEHVKLWNEAWDLAAERDFFVREAGDPLARAFRTADLDEAVQIIVAALGIAGVTVSSKEFSEHDRKTYAELLDCRRRATFLKGWIDAEIDAAAERVGKGG